MSIRATFKAAGLAMFNAFGDVIENVTYSSAGTWNPETESATNASESTRIAVKVNKKSTYGDAGGASEAWYGDLEAVILQDELTATPKAGDTITFNGSDFQVKEHVNAAGVVWKLRLSQV